MKKKKDEAGMFVLISNETEVEKLSDLDMLKEYKQQHSVESRFRILKDPYYVDEIFLKKPERVEAFGYVMIIAVLILNVIERRVRKVLKEKSMVSSFKEGELRLHQLGQQSLTYLNTKILAIPMGNS